MLGSPLGVLVQDAHSYTSYSLSSGPRPLGPAAKLIHERRGSGTGLDREQRVSSDGEQPAEEAPTRLSPHRRPVAPSGAARIRYDEIEMALREEGLGDPALLYE
jgi:hypothetical protein